MLTKKLAMAACAAALGLSMMAPAQAQNANIGIGVASTDLGTGLKLTGGAKLGSNFGWELQYTNWGKDVDNTFGVPVDVKATSFGASGIAYLPLQGAFSGFGKIGIHQVRAKASVAGISVSDSSTELGVGVGLLWDFNAQAAARVEFENIGGSGGNVLSLGVQFKF
jgi:OmpA-OmpF porin, OOP family